jgi:predicted transcriptional regulator
MARTLAASMGLLAFAVCLIAGILVDNTFATAVWRAMIAMIGTVVIGLIVGTMGQKMMDEKRIEEEKLKLNETETPQPGR